MEKSTKKNLSSSAEATNPVLTEAALQEIRRLLEIGQILGSVLTNEERTALVAASEKGADASPAG